MTRVDLVLLRQGHPVVVVEAKAHPVPPDFREAVLEQLRLYAMRTNSEWLLAVDPHSALIYSRDSIGVPVAKITTSEIVESAGLPGVTDVGESVLVIAVDRWLRSLPTSAQVLKRYPELSEFVEALREVDESVREFALD